MFAYFKRRVTRNVLPHGGPVRAVIAPAACGGFLLFIDYTRRQIAADVDLGIRFDEYEIPNADEFAAADQGLAEMGLTRTGPWQPDGYPGKFIAPIFTA
ncbi:hypothetical protein [Actinoplanes flavus]|uniref:Uncharacterized protein n=1 Tax=Actinoplanes flavus TaxID=2820290 RepID=A0ABS3UMJ1_9ACTN|nr:hypothetical protein [Actinoplanes flavus]MBO3740003.1 hypothetical protein [Actinoplanes flavus]